MKDSMVKLKSALEGATAEPKLCNRELCPEVEEIDHGMKNKSDEPSGAVETLQQQG